MMTTYAAMARNAAVTIGPTKLKRLDGAGVGEAVVTLRSFRVACHGGRSVRVLSRRCVVYPGEGHRRGLVARGTERSARLAVAR